MGQRIAKHQFDPTGVTWEKSTYYVRDAQGNVMATYEKVNPGTASLKVKERDIYGSSRVGMYTKQVEMIGATSPSTSSFQHETGSRQYELSNHLGNVLAVITDRKRPLDLGDYDFSGDGNNDSNSPQSGTADNRVDFYRAELIASTDYSPFGVDLNARSFSSSSYRYGFNGMEKDNEVKTGSGSSDGNSYDYGARIYDGRLGRWLSVDRKYSKYPSYTPYNYCLNNPLVAVDPDGNEKVIVVGTQHDNGAGNKMSFMMQAIRQIRKFGKGEEQTTVMLFTEGYTKNQIDEFKKTASKYGCLNIVEVNSSSELINYINSKSVTDKNISDTRSADKITNLSMFSHGLPDRIAFGYATDRENQVKMDLDVSNTNELQKGAFDINSEIHSYACRTAFGGETSLAQNISNATGATVYAFARRSSYVNSFSTPTIRDYFRAATTGEKYLGGSYVGLLMYTVAQFKQDIWDPKVPAGAYIKQMKLIMESVNDPKHRYKVDGALWDNRGAAGDVVPGDTPAINPDGEFKFTPKR